MSAASSTSSAVGAPKLVPRAAALDRRHHVRVGVAEDQRPPGADVVDVAVAVDVVEIGALAALDEQRLPAHRAEGAHGRIDAAREQVQRLREESLGARPDGARHRGTA